MLIGALFFSIALAGAPPSGDQLSGTFTFGVAGVGDAERAPLSLQLVQLSCVSGRCSVATFDLEPCAGDAKIPIAPIIELFSAETLEHRRRADGVVELVKNDVDGYSYVFTFRMERDARGVVWLKEFAEKTTIIRSKVTFERVAAASPSIASVKCGVAVPGFSPNGVPAPTIIGDRESERKRSTP